MDDWPAYKSPDGVTTRQRDFADRIIKMTGLYSSAVIMNAPDGSDFHSASGFLLRPRQRTFLVTNSHVMAEYRRIAREHGGAVFTFGGQSFEPNIVDEMSHDFVDIATLDVTGIEFERASPGYWSSGVTLETYSPVSWPPDPPRLREPIVVVGWPAKHRAFGEKHAVEFAAFPMIGMAIGSVEPGWFAVPFEREHWRSTDGDPDSAVVAEIELGGMSGSPVFAMHRAGVMPIHLIGIVVSHGRGLDVLYCARTDLIDESGAIARPA